MFPAFLAILFLGSWLFHELSRRRDLGLHPATLKELYFLAEKKKTSRPLLPPLLFAFSCSLLFSAWEGWVWDLYQRKWIPQIFTILIGLALMAKSLRDRHLALAKSSASHFSRRDLFLFWLTWNIFWGSYLSLILLAPWIALRSRFLPNKNAAA